MNPFAGLAAALDDGDIHGLLRTADASLRPFLRRTCHRVARPRVNPREAAVALAQCALEEGAEFAEQARAWLDASGRDALRPRTTGANVAFVLGQGDGP